MNDYAADVSVSTYTDDGSGNTAINDYTPDGTPVDDTSAANNDNSGYYPDSAYAPDNGTNQSPNDDADWNA